MLGWKTTCHMLWHFFKIWHFRSSIEIEIESLLTLISQDITLIWHL